MINYYFYGVIEKENNCRKYLIALIVKSLIFWWVMSRNIPLNVADY